MKQSCALTLAACVGLLAFTSRAQAEILLPGQSIPPPPLVQEGVLGPANFDMLDFTPFTGPGLGGLYHEFVSSGRTGNPFSGLSFEYQFFVAPTSPLPVDLLGVSGFAGWQTNVTFTPGGTVAPTSASRSANGDSIFFGFAPPVLAGQTSMWVIIDTDAPADALGVGALFSPPGTAAPIHTLGPGVPEPSTLSLALAGVPLACAFGYRRLRRSKPACP